MQKKPIKKNKRTEYLRQEAYCYYAAGEFNKAIAKLEALPKDSAVTALLTKINQAIEDGIHGKISEELVDDEPLSSLALGLSAMARKHLNKCEFKGTDERSREKGLFQQNDYDQIKKLLDNIKGRRPRDRAEYQLSLAALSEKMPDFEKHTQMHTYLMWYFASLAEAAMSENIEVDVVRCYCIESLRFHSPFPRKKLEDAWALLLGTYLSKNIGPSVLLRKAYEGEPLFWLFKKKS
ncbi:MAG: hypothetical protein AYP45_08630 [Candidatus Brocadia carolinensis]|uniref:Uncharacterized protein n=1 Tax=Candidatus Brocadia carolinensis TaxID=1004156 RepID=A0A1V4ATS9_9BACT|nr:MAG: hypothetical protein AYP45_08630 [Candidatus Brocadia caroliniensis]